MAKRRHQVPLTSKTVDEFVDWAGSAPMSDVDIVRRSIADSCATMQWRCSAGS